MSREEAWSASYADVPGDGIRPSRRHPLGPWQPGWRARLAFDVTLAAAGIGYLVLALQLGLGTTARPGPGFFPVVAAVVLIGFLAIDLAEVAWAVRRRLLPAGSGRVPLRVWLALAAIGLYIPLLDVLGHAVTASVVTALLLRLLGSRRSWAIVFIAILTGFGTDLVFSTLLRVRLPDGFFEIGFSAWI